MSNVYRNSGVLIGNWVEDRRGLESLTTRGLDVAPFSAVSEARASFRRPGEATSGAHEGPVLPPTGMPAHLLFAHGVRAVDRRDGADERYAPVSRLAFSGTGVRIDRALEEHPPADARDLIRRESTRERAAETDALLALRARSDPRDPPLTNAAPLVGHRRPPPAAALDPYASMAKIAAAPAADTLRHARADQRDTGHTVVVNGVVVGVPRLAPAKTKKFSETFVAKPRG
jgi:hypothetical protein